MEGVMDDNHTEKERSRRFSWIALVLCLVVLPAVVYLPSLFAPFHYDDLHSIQRNPHLKLENTAAFFHNPSLFDENPGTRMYRPVLLVTYAVDAFFWGRDPFGFHLANLLLHLLVGITLFLLLRALLEVQGRPASPWWACLGAVAFLLHPLATEGVVYVSCRSSQLAAFGYLGALFGYVRARREPRWPNAMGWILASMALAAIAFGSKAIAVTLPAALCLVELLFLTPRPLHARGLGRAVLALLPFVLLACGYLVLRQEVMGSTGVNLTPHRFYEGGHELTGGRSVQSNLFTQAAVFWKYLALTAWPMNLNIAHHMSVAHTLAEPRVWLSLLGLVLYFSVAAVCLKKRMALMTLALVWLPLTLSPTSSIIPLNVVMSEHRLYLPLTLFLSLLTIVAVRLGRKAGIPSAPVMGLVSVVLLLWAGRTAMRQFDYHEAGRLWGKAVALSPDNFRARNYFGNALVARRDFSGARDQYRHAYDLYPESMDTRINLGEVNIRIASMGGDPAAWAEGERMFRGILAEEPRHVLARLKLGRLLMLRGKASGNRPQDFEGAEEEFRTVLRMARGLRFRKARIWAWTRLADLHEDLGNLDRAVLALKAILREIPTHTAVQRRLRALCEKMGDPRGVRLH